MNIPNLELHAIMDEQGKPHPSFQLYMSGLNQQLKNNLSDQGFKIPQQPTATITALNTAQSVGALLYDNETHQLKVNINGTFRVVQVV